MYAHRHPVSGRVGFQYPYMMAFRCGFASACRHRRGSICLRELSCWQPRTVIDGCRASILLSVRVVTKGERKCLSRTVTLPVSWSFPGVPVGTGSKGAYDWDP